MYLNEKALREHFDGDEELIGELLEVFKQTYPETLQNVETAVEVKNFPDLEIHAHTLKGMISNFFADELREAAFNLEKIGRSKTDEPTSEYISKLKDGLPTLVEEIKGIL